ncbi:MAG: hypothetical protein ACLFU8_11055 [Anaerolineales bacterium]
MKRYRGKRSCRHVLLLSVGILLLLTAALPTSSAQAGSIPASPASDLWVDAVNGDDSNDGKSPSTAFRTLQKAADVAQAGTTIHVLPGVYRESVRPAHSGSDGAPIVYLAEEGAGSVVVRGSEPSSALSWSRLTANTIGLPAGVDPDQVYYADLSGWALSDSPRFVVTLDDSDRVGTRLSLAREPDWQVTREWRHHELWWTADGGWDVAGCDPSDPANHWNCDLEWRCDATLTDRNAFSEPDPRIEAGDLTALGDITGAELVALDSKWGHYLYRRTVVEHDPGSGQLVVDTQCLQDGGTSDPGLGWGTKYYLENHPALLDSPGEWWYDETAKRLYLWPLQAGNPAAQPLEISLLSHGFDLTDRSYITLDGLTVELFNENAVHQANYWAQKSYGNRLRNLTLRYANQGVVVEQSVRSDQPAENVTRDFTLENSEIAHMDTHGLFLSPWWDGAPDPGTFPRSGIYDTTIRGNEFHHLGFHTDLDDAIGVKIQFADRLRFEENHVHDVAHNGVQFLWSVVDSEKSYDFESSEILIGEILVKDNLFEETCQLTTDCGGLKFWGTPPHNHVFRDVLVTGNVFRNILGWSYVAEQRVGWWSGGEGCQVQGLAAFGLYLDYTSGIHAHRNIAYNNSYAGVMLSGTWRDGDLIFTNNVIANSLYGFRPSGTEEDSHGGSVNTQILNNIIVGNEGYGIYQCTADENFGNLSIDHNLYYNNGWRPYEDGGVWQAGAMAVRIYAPEEREEQKYYPTLADIQDHPAGWEAHGRAGDPQFRQYDPHDHDLHDGSWPDFHLTPASETALNRGGNLPASLTALLDKFGIADPVWGAAYDIGRYEGSFTVSVSPPTRKIEVGETATYTIAVASLGGFASEVTLAATNPDPRFQLSLDPTVVTVDSESPLVLTDGGGASNLWYQIPITATGGGFTQTLEVRLLIGGSQVYLPLIMRNR